MRKVLYYLILYIQISSSWCKVFSEIRRVESHFQIRRECREFRLGYQNTTSKRNNKLHHIDHWHIISWHIFRLSLFLWWFASNSTLCKLQIENCLNLINRSIFDQQCKIYYQTTVALWTRITRSFHALNSYEKELQRILGNYG